MKSKTVIGREGERMAQVFLARKGYRILDANWRWHNFELDIVALNEETLVIVEVKTRSKGYLVNPEGAIDRKKICRLTAAADSYAQHLEKVYPVRFDIVTIVTDGKGGVDIEHIEDAYFSTVL
ncbi:MAG: YraN family protein [Tannerellaceae bacterium]|nr:YraN family protein [Tannerellaceae bacterium]